MPIIFFVVNIFLEFLKFPGVAKFRTLSKQAIIIFVESSGNTILKKTFIVLEISTLTKSQLEYMKTDHKIQHVQ